MALSLHTASRPTPSRETLAWEAEVRRALQQRANTQAPSPVEERTARFLGLGHDPVSGDGRPDPNPASSSR